MRCAEIEALLPAVFQRTLRPASALSCLLEVMEALHADAEATLGDLDVAFDPRRTSAAMVLFLSRWVDLDRLYSGGIPDGDDATGSDVVSTGLGRLRELVADAAYLSQWRGTTRGLRRFLQVATGLSPFSVDEYPAGETGKVQPFHVVIHAPAEAEAHHVLLQRIVEAEKPAYVTYEMRFSR